MSTSQHIYQAQLLLVLPQKTNLLQHVYLQAFKRNLLPVKPPPQAQQHLVPCSGLSSGGSTIDHFGLDTQGEGGVPARPRSPSPLPFPPPLPPSPSTSSNTSLPPSSQRPSASDQSPSPFPKAPSPILPNDRETERSAQ